MREAAQRGFAARVCTALHRGQAEKLRLADLGIPVAARVCVAFAAGLVVPARTDRTCWSGTIAALFQ
jgi:hypothetical protein